MKKRNNIIVPILLVIIIILGGACFLLATKKVEFNKNDVKQSEQKNENELKEEKNETAVQEQQENDKQESVKEITFDYFLQSKNYTLEGYAGAANNKIGIINNDLYLCNTESKRLIKVATDVIDIIPHKSGQLTEYIIVKGNNYQELSNELSNKVIFISNVNGKSPEILKDTKKLQFKADEILQPSGFSGASMKYIILKENILYELISSDGSMEEGDLHIIAFGIDKIKQDRENIVAEKNNDFTQMIEVSYVEYK